MKRVAFEFKKERACDEINYYSCGRLACHRQCQCRPNGAFNTFGPGDTYNTNGGRGIGFGAPDAYDLSYRFTIAQATAYSLDKIELAATLLGGTNELDVWLMGDAAGQPGAIIEAFNFTGAMGPFGAASPTLTAILPGLLGVLNEFGPPLPPNPFLAADSVLHPVLSPGTPYWLVASAPVADTEAVWNFSLPPVSGTVAGRFGLGPWQVYPDLTLGAFRISGSPVSATNPIPAPGALLLGGLGVGVVSWLRKRKAL